MGADNSKARNGDGVNELNENHCPSLSEIARMDRIIRKKVHGVHYNMKIILCGMRGTGKSCLWQRFQGMPFTEKYSPTPEIQSATINWHSSEDSVKVEVWDVVDKAFATKNKKGIELLDASIVDIYNGTHAVIFMISPFSLDSLEYVRTRFKDVPQSTSILLVLNFRDQFPPPKTANNSNDIEKSSTITEKPVAVTIEDINNLCVEIKGYRKQARLTLEHNRADENDLGVHAFEVSLLNCFGLDILYMYLELPFLRLKQHSLRLQLQKASEDMATSNKKLLCAISENSGLSSPNALYREQQKLLPQPSPPSHEEQAGDAAAAPDALPAPASMPSDKTLSEDEGGGEEIGAEVALKKKRNRRRGPSTAAAGLGLPGTGSGASGEKEPASKASALKLTHYSESSSPRAVKLESENVFGHVDSYLSGLSTTPSPSPTSNINDSNANIATVGTGHAAEAPDLRAFRPSMAAADSLDGFLELSDEDERRLRASKQRIRAFAKNREDKIDRRPLGSSPPVDTNDDEDEDGEGPEPAKASPRARLMRVASTKPKPKTPIADADKSTPPAEGRESSKKLKGKSVEKSSRQVRVPSPSPSPSSSAKGSHAVDSPRSKNSSTGDFKVFQSSSEKDLKGAVKIQSPLQGEVSSDDEDGDFPPTFSHSLELDSSDEEPGHGKYVSLDVLQNKTVERHKRRDIDL